MMQQAVITDLDLQRPRLVRAEDVLADAVEVGVAAAFEDEYL